MKRLIALALLLGSFAQAQTLTPRAALERLVNATALQAAWFEPAILAQVPLAQLQAIVAQYKADLGALKSIGDVQPNAGVFRLVFERGTALANMALGEGGRVAGLFLGPPVFSSPTLGPAAALERLFKTSPAQASWFVPAFLAQVPLDQITAGLSSFKTQFGAFQTIQAVNVEAGQYTVVFEHGLLTASLATNAAGQFTSLGLQNPRPRVAASLTETLASFKALSGRVSVLVLEDGKERAALNPEAPLAVGSAFKLAVLATLKKQVEAGTRRWTDTAELQVQDKSLPSGVLQTRPVGTRMSLQELAELMISISDNTATNVLIRMLGREAIEPLAGRNKPLLTTRDLFILKTAPNADLLARYQAGNEAARRAVLEATLTRPLPTVESYPITAVTALDVEWLFSAREMCGLVSQVADLPLFGINPGVADPKAWARVAFKGGSEPGVINLTTQLRSASGKTYCVVATWNNEALLDEGRFAELYGALIETLK